MKACMFIAILGCAHGGMLKIKDDDGSFCAITKNSGTLLASCGATSVDIIGDINDVRSRLPCEKGFYKENGNMGDACVECSSSDFKNTIGYETCTPHPANCAAASFCAGGSTTASCICELCPPNTFSTGFTTINQDCEPQPTCNAGEELLGDSPAAKGTCTACPAVKHNSDGIGECEYHGNCPAGKQPSHLDANSASFCESCPPNTYTNEVDRSLCEPHTSCDPHKESLIGESTTNPGTCTDRCQEKTTIVSDYGGLDGSPGKSSYLKDLTLTCGNHQALGATGLSRFKMNSANTQYSSWVYLGYGIYYKEYIDSVNIQYAYRCCDIDLNSEEAIIATSHATPCDDNGNGNAIYLDRHTVDCGTGKVITEERTHQGSCSSNQLQIEYKCRTGGTNTCITKSTTCEDTGGGNIHYFDKHNAECPEDKPLMRKFKMSTACSGDKMKWDYTCCA